MIKAAVIGAGAMGKHHVRVYHEIPEIELVAVPNLNPAQTDTIARLYDAKVFTDYLEMPDKVRPDVVSVAVPTSLHFEAVSAALDAGCHVLVEKPIAATVEQGVKLIKKAEQQKRVLMIGHIERFNPAIIEMKRRLMAEECGQIYKIHTRRLDPFPQRIRDVGVLIDLATHDLDVMRYLTGSEALRAYAEIKQNIHTTNEDLLGGILHFADGTLGLLEVNWLTPTKIREVYVTGEQGMFVANYITQDLFFYEIEKAKGVQWGALSVMRGVNEGAMIRYAINRKEPMRAEVEAFLQAVTGESKVYANGADGLAALELALALIRSGLEHTVVAVNQMKVTTAYKAEAMGM